MSKAATYKLFFKTEKKYLFLIVSNLVGRFGDSIDSIAYGFMVYELTGSAAWLAVVYGVNSIPTILFQPFAGALVEFFNKKTVVILCDIGRGCIVFCTGIMLICGVLKPWHLLLLTFANSCFESFRIPAGLAIIPSVLQKKNYSMGLSLNQSACRISELIGLGCAGALIGLLGTGGAIVIDAITFFLSALLFFLLKLPKAENHITEHRISVKSYLNDLGAGIQYFKQNHIVFVICMIGFLLNVTAVPLEKLQAAFVSECLNLGVSALSLGSISMTLGLILGTVAFVYLEKIISTKIILVWGGGFIGVLYFGLILAGTLELSELRYMTYGILLFIFGFINSLIGMCVQVTCMKSIPDEYIGRVGSIFSAMACSSIPAGSFLLAVVLPFLSIIETYFLVGIATIFIFTLIGRVRSIRSLE